MRQGSEERVVRREMSEERGEGGGRGEEGRAEGGVRRNWSEQEGEWAGG